MSKEIEEWKDIEWAEGLYQVSDWGRVRSVDHYITGRNQYGAVFKVLKKGKIKKTFKHCGTPYYFTCIKIKGKDNPKDIHRLVAEAFIPNPEGKPCVGHWDCDVANNAAWNLYWCTHKENNNHPITKQRMSEGQKRYFANGGNVSFKGKHFTDESKKKLSASLKGKTAGEKNGMFGVRVKKNLKPVEKIDPITGEILEIFDCVKDAALSVGCAPSNISGCCRGKYEKVYGYIWRYHST